MRTAESIIFQQCDDGEKSTSSITAENMVDEFLINSRPLQNLKKKCSDDNDLEAFVKQFNRPMYN